MVQNAYKVTLTGAFVPLVAGMFWKRATNLGGLLSVLLGLGAWLLAEAFYAGALIPPQFVGLFASAVGMIVGSMATPRSHHKHA
jgi:Na+/proline symporter